MSVLELTLPPATLQALDYAVSRELTDGDLNLLARPQNITSVPVKAMRETHHQLARLLATGMKQVEVSAITGYSQSRISILKGDPAFKELIAHYTEVQDSAYADIAGQMAALSSSAMSELRDRLEDDPAQFSNMQVLEVMKTLLDRTGFGPASKAEVKHSHLHVNADDLARVKQLVKEAQIGNVTPRDISQDRRSTSPSSAPVTISIPSNGRSQFSAKVARIEGKGQGIRKENAKVTFPLGEGVGL